MISNSPNRSSIFDNIASADLELLVDIDAFAAVLNTILPHFLLGVAMVVVAAGVREHFVIVRVHLLGLLIGIHLRLLLQVLLRRLHGHLLLARRPRRLIRVELQQLPEYVQHDSYLKVIKH